MNFKSHIPLLLYFVRFEGWWWLWVFIYSTSWPQLRGWCCLFLYGVCPYLCVQRLVTFMYHKRRLFFFLLVNSDYQVCRLNSHLPSSTWRPWPRLFVFVASTFSSEEEKDHLNSPWRHLIKYAVHSCSTCLKWVGVQVILICSLANWHKIIYFFCDSYFHTYIALMFNK